MPLHLANLETYADRIDWHQVGRLLQRLVGEHARQHGVVALRPDLEGGGR